MTTQTIQRLTTPEVVQRCVESARSYLRALMDANSRVANRHHTAMFDAYAELTRRDVHHEILALMGHEEPIVRQWSATHALEFAPAQAVPVLEELQAAAIGVPSLNAEIALRMWRDGTLRLKV